jgi:hydroxymethylbilane synthase
MPKRCIIYLIWESKRMKRLIIGTRASKLAMIQTQWVVECLKEQDPALPIVIEPIRTTGDALTHVPLTTIGGDGVFVQEIERALLEKRIDLAVHSLKDLPTAQTAGLHVVAVGRREDVRDVLVVNGQSDHAAGEAGRPQGSPLPYTEYWEGKTTPVRIGTCSLRRTAQIRALFPGVEILPLRGNVDTRLRKLDAGDYDGIVLAAAGLHRLGVHERLADRLRYLPIEVMMPAPGQGALAVEVRDEAEMQMLIAPLRDAATEAATSAERMFMRRLGAGCYLPVAAHGEIRGESLTLKGLVISLDGQEQVRVSRSMPWTAETDPENAGRLGVQLAEEALARGAAEIINALSVTRIQERQHA